MRKEICAMCKVKTSKVGIPCPSENESVCHAAPTLKREWSELDGKWKVIILKHQGHP